MRSVRRDLQQEEARVLLAHVSHGSVREAYDLRPKIDRLLGYYRVAQHHGNVDRRARERVADVPNIFALGLQVVVLVVEFAERVILREVQLRPLRPLRRHELVSFDERTHREHVPGGCDRGGAVRHRVESRVFHLLEPSQRRSLVRRLGGSVQVRARPRRRVQRVGIKPDQTIRRGENGALVGVRIATRELRPLAPRVTLQLRQAGERQFEILPRLHHHGIGIVFVPRRLNPFQLSLQPLPLAKQAPEPRDVGDAVHVPPRLLETPPRLLARALRLRRRRRERRPGHRLEHRRRSDGHPAGRFDARADPRPRHHPFPVPHRQLHVRLKRRPRPSVPIAVPQRRERRVRSEASPRRSHRSSRVEASVGDDEVRDSRGVVRTDDDVATACDDVADRRVARVRALGLDEEHHVGERPMARSRETFKLKDGIRQARAEASARSMRERVGRDASPEVKIGARRIRFVLRRRRRCRRERRRRERRARLIRS